MDNKIYAGNRGAGVTRKPYGTGLIWGQKGQIFQSEDLSPNLGSTGNQGPDAGLPVSFVDPEFNIGVAIQMGMIVAFDPETKKMVPANGGQDMEITYDARDTEYGVLNKTHTKRVKAGEKRTFKANFPVGWALQDVMQNPACYNGTKLMINQESPDFRRQGQIRMAVVYKTADSKYDLKPGDYVKGDGAPDRAENPMANYGMPVKWIEGTDKMNQRAGKVMWVEDFEEFDKQGTDVYGGETYGAKVHGGGTMGFPMELYNFMGGEEVIKDQKFKKKIITISIIKG